MMKNYLLLGLCVSSIIYGMCGCGPQQSTDTFVAAVGTAAEGVMSDVEEAEPVAENNFTWQDIPDDEKPVRFSFKNWLTIMNHIKDNYWSRPSARMLADAGLEVLMESDSVDVDGIKSVDFRYGRQMKSIVNPSGQKTFTYGGDHSVLFMVDAYTSSGAEIYFRSPADLKDFIQQAIDYGVAQLPDGSFVVCDKPMGKGIHKVSKTYEYTETKKGKYQERYYLAPEYNPSQDWQVCYITLDFLRHRLDIE